ncbi:MAG: type II toxin-antitoxin system VapC family toxin [Candidatus Omnitrophica bacterium]|nr:type II toxin-antitoxin system VapC family toxin [Candidatus Omnitrophota bacterium]
MHKLKLYLDTSVFGGVFDEQFSDASRKFFEAAERERFQIVISAVVFDEISLAPRQVREFFDGLLSRMEVVDIDKAALDLQGAYLKHNIVTAKWYDDALHVALATVAGCDGIVSWNFKHIVNFRKIPLYNAVNILSEYKSLFIHSPMEVVYEGK